MSQTDRAAAFRALHVPGAPVVLYNIWDAGSARTVASAGARALATGSWSVAAAQGYGDGEQIPLDMLVATVARIVATVDLPLTVDLEGGYAAAPADVAANVARVIATGAVGINFEDRIVAGAGLYPVDAQAARIAAIRAAADAAGVALFINARTDLFLQASDGHGALVDAAVARAQAYADAGADGFFVPGLSDHALIAAVCRRVARPVNVMMTPAHGALAEVAAMGVARISFGPGPYRDAQKGLAAGAAAALSALAR